MPTIEISDLTKSKIDRARTIKAKAAEDKSDAWRKVEKAERRVQELEATMLAATPGIADDPNWITSWRFAKQDIVKCRAKAEAGTSDHAKEFLEARSAVSAAVLVDLGIGSLDPADGLG